jgi:hypothetical protein
MSGAIYGIKGGFHPFPGRPERSGGQTGIGRGKELHRSVCIHYLAAERRIRRIALRASILSSG